MSVAPNLRAKSNVAGWTSTPTIRAAPDSRAPSMTLSPTPPSPTTATVSPRRTCAVLIAAPAPVMTPRPRTAARGIGPSSGTWASWFSCASTRSAKAPSPHIWTAGAPPAVIRAGAPVGRGVSSGCRHRCVGPARQAAPVPARLDERADHVVADRDVGDVAVDLRDDARHLMADVRANSTSSMSNLPSNRWSTAALWFLLSGQAGIRAPVAPYVACTPTGSVIGLWLQNSRRPS